MYRDIQVSPGDTNIIPILTQFVFYNNGTLRTRGAQVYVNGVETCPTDLTYRLPASEA